MPADGAGIPFGPYTLLRRLARGGMAEVFLAQQRGLEGFDRRVAVKRILPQLADARDFVQMFLGEAKLAAQLSHPNIVHIYDFGRVDTDYFIAMEYVDGVHAGQLVKHGGETDRMPAVLIARLGADTAAALHYAHELRDARGKRYSLVHRDVSPANVMVSFDGVVKLCDFGIAKAEAIGDQLTRPGQVKGKYAYMSPEQIAGAPLDGRSDVFSLGIVLWELTTGRTIVPRGDAVAAMLAIRDGKLMPIAKAAPQTPAPLAKAITWALQIKRDDRPTAMELAHELETFLKSSPELATAIQLGSWLRPRFHREPVADVATPAGGTQVSDELTNPRDASSRAAAVVAITADPVRDRAAHTATALARPPVAIAVISHRAAIATTVIAPEPLRRGDLVPSPPPVASTVILPPPHTSSAGPALATEVITKLRQRRRMRLALGIGGAVVVALLSFAIALAARGRWWVAAAPADAAIDAPTDAPIVAMTVAPIDAAIDAPTDAPVDTMTDAPTAERDSPTVLEVRTRPDRALVKVGEQSHAAPTQFTLPAGRYFVDAELDGWMPERRAVSIRRGERVVQEIVFTTRLTHRPRPASSGKLTVQTTPPSEVFLGSRWLAETPFADLALDPGAYTLRFKHPQHATVVKRVTITAGKTTKLSFALP